MRESSQHDQTDDTELDALLLQTTKRIDAYRAADSTKDTPQSQVNDVPDSQLLTWDVLTTSPSFTSDELLVPNPITPEYTDPFPFTKNQAFELIKYFRFEAECFYPFIPFDSMTALAGAVIDCPNGAPAFVADTGSEDWCDMADNRNLDMLRILLACALAAKSKKETETACRLVSTVSEKFTTNLNGPEFDAKDIAIATLIVSSSPNIIMPYVSINLYLERVSSPMRRNRPGLEENQHRGKDVPRTRTAQINERAASMGLTDVLVYLRAR